MIYPMQPGDRCNVNARWMQKLTPRFFALLREQNSVKIQGVTDIFLIIEASFSSGRLYCRINRNKRI
jgi:hypothetical protein